MHSEARLYIDLVNAAITAFYVGVLLLVCVLAWTKGRSAERFGASIYCVSVLVTYAFEVITGAPPPITIELTFDTLVAVGFLYLAIRYNNLWLGAAMMLKGAQLALHASHLTDVVDPHIGVVNLYAASLNLISYLIALSMLGGVIASLRTPRSADASRSQYSDDPVRPGAD